MIQSAGFIIVDFSGEAPTALCLLDSYNRWDFPKGHLEAGESIIDAALRETEEECGLCTQDFMPSSRSAKTMPYEVPGGKKVCTYFFAERISNTVPKISINPNIGIPEHVTWRWFPVASLRNKMSKRLWPVLDELEAWCDQTTPEFQD